MEEGANSRSLLLGVSWSGERVCGPDRITARGEVAVFAEPFLYVFSFVAASSVRVWEALVCPVGSASLTICRGALGSIVVCRPALDRWGRSE